MLEIVQHGVAVAERAALHVLARQPHADALPSSRLPSAHISAQPQSTGLFRRPSRPARPDCRLSLRCR